MGAHQSFGVKNCKTKVQKVQKFFFGPFGPMNQGEKMSNKALINRSNALKSTGPKTKEGKAIASQNALKHGLLSKDLILKDESSTEFDGFRQAIYQALAPLGCLEEVLVEKIVSSAWRFRRLIKSEKLLFEEKDKWCTLEPKFIDVFSRRNGSSMQILSRYESTIEKSFYKAMHELQRIQAMRLGLPVMAPIALDINLNDPKESGFVSQNESLMFEE